MFYFGLAGGGFKPGLQHSVTSGFPSAFPKRQSGAYPQPEFAFCSLQVPAVACRPSVGTWITGQALHRIFILQATTRAKDQAFPVTI